MRQMRGKRGRTAAPDEEQAEVLYWEGKLGARRVQQLRYAFDVHKLEPEKGGKGGREALPVRRIRDALWDLDHDVSPRHLREWLREMGLRPGDELSFWEFCFTYHYLFVAEDGTVGVGGDYGDTVADMLDGGDGTLGMGMGMGMGMGSTAMRGTATAAGVGGGAGGSAAGPAVKSISAVAAAILSGQTWHAGPKQHERLMRSLMVGRTVTTKKLLFRMRDAFEALMDGNGEVSVDDLGTILKEVGRDPSQVHALCVLCVCE
jgi:hypothetical protein